MRRELADDGDGDAEKNSLNEAAGIIGFDPPIGLSAGPKPVKGLHRPTSRKNLAQVFCDVIVAEEGCSQEDINWDAALKEKQTRRQLGGDATTAAVSKVRLLPDYENFDARSALLALDVSETVLAASTEL